jgi:hypothetical protein
MGKELGAIELDIEIVENTVEQPLVLVQLSELSLALVGGGGGTVIF